MGANTGQTELQILNLSNHFFAQTLNYDTNSGGSNEVTFTYINGGSLATHVPETLLIKFVSGTAAAATINIKADAVVLATVALAGVAAGVVLPIKLLTGTGALVDQAANFRVTTTVQNGGAFLIDLIVAGNSY